MASLAGPDPGRDRVQDGPMTYNETIVECAIHTILAVRQVYPSELFTRQAVVALYYEDAPDEPNALERYVFLFQMLCANADRRDRDWRAKRRREAEIPADGVPFAANAHDTNKAVLSTTGLTEREPAASVLHPLKTLESGVINVRGVAELSSQTTEPSASWQRDLDDPALADGVSPHEVPMRRRKLYAQADDSDESMADDSRDSRDEDEL
ncbi:hypothetical protein MNAN1_003664 [Malassezia nana]|uniref:Uncharacterized protein n=1 Tax=Malassezia nana TaxID=180528 RepID=A0AAF0ETR7_9BASI|nr:hypothetical protein MNAN1_003664 [Malassezia nana]